MIKGPIYEPKGKANEYAELALNIYNGCTHGCVYCYAPSVLRKDAEEFRTAAPRDEIMKKLETQLKNSGGFFKGRMVHLCFTCDPYPRGVDTKLTDDIIDLLHSNEVNVQILTKNGTEIMDRILPRLGKNDSVGVTVSCSERMRLAIEPNAAPVGSRLNLLWFARCKNIPTWVSCEPVYEPQFIFDLIKNGDYIDLFKIGKLNYQKSEIDWSEFGHECERLCRQYGRNYLIKNDLRHEMEAGLDPGR